MARDAIARQYDVDKNSITLTCEPGKADYRPGLITFYAKKGKSLDLDKIRASIAATRLSGGTSMRMDYLEITARGDLVAKGNAEYLMVSGTRQMFWLKEAPGNPQLWQQLRDAVAQGKKVSSVT